MENKNHPETGRLKNRLLKKPKQFNFFQVIRLLRRIAAEAGGESTDFSGFLRRHVRIRPPVSLGFADSDVCAIRDISTDGMPRFEITASFLGLYGPASPLPTYYTEEIIWEALDEESVKKDFLDIFNDPVFKLFYECWSKYRLNVKIADEKSAPDLQRLYSLIGLAEPRLRDRLPESSDLLRYTGLLMCKPRSALGLKTLIADFFQLPGVEIDQCVERQVAIDSDQHCLLGRQACELGGDTHIGTRILDYSGKIHITCGPVDTARFHAISPGTEQYDRFVRVLNVYLDQPLDIEIRFVVQPEEVQTTTLGGPRWCRLGYHTWLSSEGNDGMEPNASYELQAGVA